MIPPRVQHEVAQRQLGVEHASRPRQPVADGVVEPEPAALDLADEERRGEGLRDRRAAKARRRGVDGRPARRGPPCRSPRGAPSCPRGAGRRRRPGAPCAWRRHTIRRSASSAASATWRAVRSIVRSARQTRARSEESSDERSTQPVGRAEQRAARTLGVGHQADDVAAPRSRSPRCRRRSRSGCGVAEHDAVRIVQRRARGARRRRTHPRSG